MASSNSKGGWSGARNSCADSECTEGSILPNLFVNGSSNEQLSSACQYSDHQLTKANDIKPRHSLTIGVYLGTFQTYIELLDDEENEETFRGSTSGGQITSFSTPVNNRKEPRDSAALEETFKSPEIDLSTNSGVTTARPTSESAKTATLDEKAQVSNGPLSLTHETDVNTAQYNSTTKLATIVRDRELPDTKRGENVTGSLIQSSASDTFPNHRDSLLPDTQAPSADVSCCSSTDANLATSPPDQTLLDTQRGSFFNDVLSNSVKWSLRDFRDALLPDTQYSDLTSVDAHMPILDRDLPNTQRNSLSGDLPQYPAGLISTDSGDAALPDTQASSIALEVYDCSSHKILGVEKPSLVLPTGDTCEESTVINVNPNPKAAVALGIDCSVADTEVGISFSTNSSLNTSVCSGNIACFHFTGLDKQNESGGPKNSSQTEPSVPPISKTSEDQQIKVDLPKISVKERKRIAVPSSRPPKLTKAMQQWILNTNSLLDPFREDDDCWLHPSPPPARVAANGTQRPVGKLQKSFTWQDRKGKHTIVLNYGIVSKLIYRKLTKQQKDGLINRCWHLSHLCGNWTCLNPAHTTVEPGSVNISRNNCFSHRSGCHHKPPCMKEKKVYLGADGKLFDLNSSTQVVSTSGEINQDDWAVTFDDGDDLTMEDAEDAESIPAYLEDDIDLFISD
jgi:hypothetical protein